METTHTAAAKKTTPSPWFYCGIKLAKPELGLRGRVDVAARRLAAGSFEVYIGGLVVTMTEEEATAHLCTERGADGKPLYLSPDARCQVEARRPRLSH